MVVWKLFFTVYKRFLIKYENKETSVNSIGYNRMPCQCDKSVLWFSLSFVYSREKRGTCVCKLSLCFSEFKINDTSTSLALNICYPRRDVTY